MRILHFVTGGFSGSTQVAIDIIEGCLTDPNTDSLLVLRRKKNTTEARVKALVKRGIPVASVSGLTSLITIFQLVRICRAFKPDVLVAHGYSEHLWGRYAAMIARVPHHIHVEHNSRERYTLARRIQARWLAKYSDFCVGCSKGVSKSLAALGMPPEKIVTICNGVAPDRFESAAMIDFTSRRQQLIMPARFARQKDHLNLIRAMALLRDSGIMPILNLAGSGSDKHLNAAKQLVKQLNLHAQVNFLGRVENLPALLMDHQIIVLSTHYEGLPLALVEGMMAGCAVVASRVIGVEEIIEHEVDGMLAEPNSPASLANCIERLLVSTPFAADLALRARIKALRDFGKPRMIDEYRALFHRILFASEI